ncbi:MAG: cation-transporting P-type ATPase [Rhodocyclaceae bacterium]
MALARAIAARLLTYPRAFLLAPPKKRGLLLRFLLQFHNVLIYVLLGAAGVTAALGHGVDTAVILAAIEIEKLYWRSRPAL